MKNPEDVLPDYVRTNLRGGRDHADQVVAALRDYYGEQQDQLPGLFEPACVVSLELKQALAAFPKSRAQAVYVWPLAPIEAFHHPSAPDVISGVAGNCIAFTHDIHWANEKIQNSFFDVHFGRNHPNPQGNYQERVEHYVDLVIRRTPSDQLLTDLVLRIDELLRIRKIKDRIKLLRRDHRQVELA